MTVIWGKGFLIILKTRAAQAIAALVVALAVEKLMEIFYSLIKAWWKRRIAAVRQKLLLR